MRILEDIVALSLGAKGSLESLGPAPADIIVVESDGSIENVDTLKAAAPGAASLGLDVFHHTFDEVANDPAIQRRQVGVAALAEECQDCSLVSVCGGGYLPHRLSAERGYRNPSVYCQDLAHLIRHVHATLPGSQPQSPGVDPSVREPLPTRNAFVDQQSRAATSSRGMARV